MPKISGKPSPKKTTNVRSKSMSGRPASKKVADSTPSYKKKSSPGTSHTGPRKK